MAITKKDSYRFAIAEEDLKLKGPGGTFGKRQTGIANCRIGNIIRDKDVMEKAERWQRRR